MQSDSACLRRVPIRKPLTFSPIALTDKPWMEHLIRMENSRSSDWCFSSLFAWDAAFHQQVAAIGNRLVIQLLYHGSPFYAFPIGQGDLEPVIWSLQQDATDHDVPLKISGITAKNMQELEEAFPGQFEYSPDAYAFDYVYEAESLALLEGRKFSPKRTHINRFLEQNPDWRFEPLTRANLSECSAMCLKWVAEHQTLGGNFADEVDALHKAFSHFDALDLEGALLRAKGEVVAFTIGKPLNSDTYIIHFEKAFPSVQGAYPMINREFARHICQAYPHLRYINRESDLGIPGLQKAKQSYHPVFLVEKYTARWKDS